MSTHEHEHTRVEDIDLTCPRCLEGLDRINAALRVDTTGLPDDRLDCLDCGIGIVRAAESGPPEQRMEIEVRVRPPLLAGTWAPVAIRCVHGTVFHHRPTAAQRARWREEAGS